MSEIFDFYTRFSADYIAWCEKHPEIARDEDKLQEAFEKQYVKWFDTPKKWLGGRTPNAYFEELKDPAVYASMFVSYIEQDMQLPEPLIECMIEHKKDVYPILRGILLSEKPADMDDDAFTEVCAECISVIDEMQMPQLYGRYIELLLAATGSESDALTENICVALEEAEEPDEIRKRLLDVYPVSEGVGKECILELLCGYKDDGMVYSLLSEEFRRDDMELAFLCELAGKLSDERLLPVLRTFLEDQSLDYLTFTSVRYAIERITGEELPDREAYGDPVYDLLANLDKDGN